MSAFKCTRKVYCKICSQEYNMSKTQWFWVDSDNFRSLDGLPLYHLVKAERCAEHAIFKPLTKNIQQFPSFEVVSDLVESERKHQHLNEHHDLPKSIYWPLNILKFMTRYGSSNVNPTPPRWRILRYGFAPRPPISKENVGETQIGCMDVSGFSPGRAGRPAPVVATFFWGFGGGTFWTFSAGSVFVDDFVDFSWKTASPSSWCSCHFMSIFLIPESQFHPICLIWSDKIGNYRQRGH